MNRQAEKERIKDFEQELADLKAPVEIPGQCWAALRKAAREEGRREKKKRYEGKDGDSIRMLID